MLVRTLLALTPAALARRLETILDTRDVSLVHASSPEEVWQLLQRQDIDLLVASEAWTSPSPANWVASVRALPEAPDVVLLTGQEDPSLRAALLAAGCLAVLNARLSDRELRGSLQTLVARLSRDVSGRLAADAARKSRGLSDVVSRSPVMAEVIGVARRVAGADSSLLVLGETGVGKERLARSVHDESARSSGPFVPVNCGAIPEGLMESELFGHEQGAFTGATRARRGHFEVAHRGTLFLDEVGDLPLHVQVKLLRVLEDRHIQRLGSEHPVRVDVRIIAATNRNLSAEVDEGRFRADLYYRLAVVTLSIPPLRDRPEDIPDLVEHYLAVFRRSLGKPCDGIAGDALAALMAHSWPGNVRELINVLERAVLLAPSPLIGVADLPPTLARPAAPDLRPGEAGPAPGQVPENLTGLPLREARARAVEGFEREYVSGLLRQTGGRVGRTAALAGVSPRFLHGLMKKLAIRKEDFRYPS
ncbi:MAG TPA: sigma-54 dependent transcriptional regulator [Longimicrobiales bacterium]|jgi:DNA-binding NtrC family response regulator